MLWLLNYLRLSRRETRILVDRRRVMRECMSVALNTIGHRSPDRRLRYILTAGLEPGSSGYARLHIKFEARFPRESCVEPLGDRVPSFYPEWDKALPPCSSAGFPSVPLLDLNACFD